jgi:spermidine synthase
MRAAEVFLISFVILFMELACIRWFGAHVLYLTFFTNCVLLACFLGMSLGCLAARQTRNYLAWTPVLLALALAAGLAMEAGRGRLERVLDVGGQASPEVVFFGTEYHVQELSRFALPMEVVNGFFFVLIALALVGPGQELGRALDRMGNRIWAYSLNLLGSLAGIVAFTALSWLEATPFWWFLIVVWGVGYFLIGHALAGGMLRQLALIACLGATLVLAGRTSGGFQKDGWTGTHHWSPYYRIDYARQPENRIFVNQIVHQGMVSVKEAFAPAYAYSLPHLLKRETGGQPFRDVLILGAGSGNDVSRALHFGAEHIDAVEIDPVILRLGRQDHPDRPYDDPRVTVHVDDGRNFLRHTERQYDLIVYALVDSLALHSGYSNLRLENYLFTHEALDAVRAKLKPGGLLVMYNYFRQGWIIDRLRRTVAEAFGAEPLVLTTPPQSELSAESRFSGFAVMLAGEVDAIDGWLNEQPVAVLNAEQMTAREGESGRGVEIGVTRLHGDADLRPATDDWPFLYVRRPSIPDVTWRGIAVMFVLSALLIAVFAPRAGRGLVSETASSSLGRQPRPHGLSSACGEAGIMFCLGVGFMLLETKAIVQAALLLGSTWLVNSAVLAVILMLMVGANLFYLAVRPRRRWPLFAGLFVTLGAAWLVSGQLGGPRWLALSGGLVLPLAPIFFSSLLFASFFEGSDASRALGFNIAGAMAGGLLENLSLVLGYQNLMLIVALAYGGVLAMASRYLK